MPLPLAIPVDQRVELESKLARRLSQRPSRIELEQRNILPGEFPLSRVRFMPPSYFVYLQLLQAAMCTSTQDAVAPFGCPF